MPFSIDSGYVCHPYSYSHASTALLTSPVMIDQSLPDWSIELLRRVNSYTDDTHIRNQWKMALQSYLGTNHTILTNLSGAKAELDINVYQNLISNQDSFPSSEKSNADQFLDFINQKNPKL